MLNLQQVHERFDVFGIKASDKLTVALLELLDSSNLFVEAVNEALAGGAELIQCLLKVRESASFLRKNIDCLRAPFDELLKDLELEDISLDSDFLPLDTQGETRLLGRLESLLDAMGPQNASLLAVNISDTYSVCNWVKNFFLKITEITLKREFEDALYHMYSHLYEHVLPHHLNDLINEEENIFSPGLFSSLAYFLAEINGR